MRSSSNAELFGRDDELARLRALHQSGARILTVVGPGGIGKTYLARAFAKLHSDGGPAPVFVSLESVSTEAGVIGAVASALGVVVPDESGADALALFLSGGNRRLIVLDNADDAVDALARLLDLWTALTENVAFVVTSREALRLPSERTLELGSLSVVGQSAEPAPAVALLSSLSGRSREERTAVEWEAMERIAQRVDGVPLALVLAASRLAHENPVALARALEESSSALVSSMRGMPARHMTVRAAIEGSWKRLDAIAQKTLAQCSVFRGGFDRESAMEVVDEDRSRVAEALDTLRDHSLLQLVGTVDGVTRYDMYWIVREFADAELTLRGGRDGAEARHAATFAALHDADPVGNLQVSPILTPRIARDEANIIVAFERSLARGMRDWALALALVADPIVFRRGPYRAFADRLGEILPARPRTAVEAKVFFCRALYRIGMGELDVVEEDLAKMRDVDDPIVAVLADLGYAMLDRRRGKIAEAIEWAESGARRASAIDHVGLEGDARLLSVSAAAAAPTPARYRVARQHADEAIAAFRSIGLDVRVAQTEQTLAQLLRDTGAFAEAAELASRAAAHLDRCGERALASIARGTESFARFLAGDPAELVLPLLTELAEEIRRLGATDLVALTTGSLGVALAAYGRANEAKNLLEECRAICFDLDLTSSRLFVSAHLASVYRTLGYASRAQGLEDEVQELAAKESSESSALYALLREGNPEHATSDDERERRAAVIEKVRADLVAFRPTSVSPGLWTLLTLELMRRRASARRPSKLPAFGPTSERPAVTIWVQDEGLWFRVGDAPAIDCRTRLLIGRLVLALARKHPNGPLSTHELLSAGWPGERMLPKSAKARLHVAISTLRKLGLRQVLDTTLDGYALNPYVHVAFTNQREPI